MCSFCGICNITGNVKTYSESWHIPRHAYLIHILDIEATSTTSDVPGHGQSGQHLYLYTPKRSLHRHLTSPDMQHPGDISGVCTHLGTSEATSKTSGRDPAPDISCPQDVVRCCQTPPGTRAISQSAGDALVPPRGYNVKEIMQAPNMQVGKGPMPGCMIQIPGATEHPSFLRSQQHR